MNLAQERIDPGEDAAIQRILAANDAMTKQAAGRRLRAQHTKHHGCVRAEFAVHDGLPEEFRIGVFAQPRVYSALVRFSNGGKDDDTQPDAHGMAIKLLDVPGDKLLADDEAQDFILVDSDVYFVADLKEYADFNAEVAAARVGLFGKLKLAFKLMLLDRALKSRVQVFTGKTPGSPLTSDYFSATPYLFGTKAVKYVARAGQIGPQGVGDKDGLGAALTRHLAGLPASFEFGVHVQTDANAHPIEDPTQSWAAHGAPYQALATLTLSVQDVTAGARLAEGLAFTPWHSLAAHRPLGAINRARRAVYQELARRRGAGSGMI